MRDGRWRASRDSDRLSPTSIMIADLQIVAYQRMIEGYACGDLLDLGCGQAPLYGVYRDKIASATCVDWPNSLHPNQHLDLAADLTQPIPLYSDEFDTILLSDVLEHIPVPDQVMSEVARLLRPGGHALIGVPFIYGIHEAPHDFHRYTEFRLRQLCQDHGLRVLELWTYGDAVHALLDMTIKYVGGRIPGDWFTRALTVIGLWHTPRAASKTPLGYALVAAKPSA